MNPREADDLMRARRLLCALQDFIRQEILAARSHSAGSFAEVAEVTEADTIFRVDRIGEGAIFQWFDEHWPRELAVEWVMEGSPPQVFPDSVSVDQTRWKGILDPIDGTRNLMYDKRSAWSLAALAPQRGGETGLQDIALAVMTELPTTKQTLCDQLSAIRGQGSAALVAERFDLERRSRRRYTPSPSRAETFAHGFASLVRFFPDAKGLLGALEEELWRRLGELGSGAMVFDDQYLSTGGQIYELLTGRDRMIGDLRPMALRKIGRPDALCCHPYDICTALILTEAGGIVEQPDGSPLAAPLDTTTAVSWVGYANRTLAERVRPVLNGLIAEFLG